MLEVSSSQQTPTAAAADSSGNAHAGIKEEEEDGGRSLSGNSRWPKQETLALLKIRFDMDVAFRDSGLKAPLWDEVSRRMNELGYNRNAKKCREKFENIYKYHKRTKEGRSGHQFSKNYPFFEQLEAFENHQSARITTNQTIHGQNPNPCVDHSEDNSASSMSSSSEEEEDEEEIGVPSKKRRTMTEFFDRLMKQVIEKQENLQRQFIEVLEKYEKNRIEREEAWKLQEMTRFRRERELLMQERSVAAAKDAAVLAFLQKFSDQSNFVPVPETLIPKTVENPISTIEVTNNESNPNPNPNLNLNLVHGIGSSRWPKEEVEALIAMKSNLDSLHRESGPRGPLWEEVSLAMKKTGYDRSAKRCKEKWENINKYFKRVKESKRRRTGDSKTCPYFQQLDALYKEKDKKVVNELKPEELLLHITDSSRPKDDGDSTEDTEEHRETNDDGLGNLSSGSPTAVTG